MNAKTLKGTRDLTQFATYLEFYRDWKEQELRVCDNCREYLGKEEMCRKCKKSFNQNL